MRFKDITKQLDENQMKFQALAMIKELHNNMAGITFIDAMAVMAPDNPARKEVQALETKINDLTNEIGEFIQKYIPDVQNAEVDDLEDEPPEEPEEDEEKPEHPTAPKKPESKPANQPKKEKKPVKESEEITQKPKTFKKLIGDLS